MRFGARETIIYTIHIILVDGAWASWLSWEQCISNECNNGEGKQRRTRRCVNPTPSHGGVPCPGKEDDFRNCTIPSMYISVMMPKWSSHAVLKTNNGC